ncbi:MAG: hypothetical protein GTO51_09085 [Candidatus Latescibacteria bacterium]|nr:hypothetical protein [Candidatus Latescibacterota bacterium]NIM22296.1 hypothetical protein [Candidatus Latescibacterota bacterium]NIM66125.1 hypothetical protein [Candidatus Latescibacterota bacterium]NIO02533.1 hypothetical protein [Candidatus Latescibacterota bacterium]NIO29447.1 hypothetical protein [Candidatus Latescibacterota bacterium]
MEKTETYRSENRVIDGVTLKFTTYRNGVSYHCVVSKLDLGGNIARSVGKTREQAERIAMTTVREILGNGS